MEEHYFTDTYALAGRSIRIRSLYESIHAMCRAYRTDSEPDFEVHTDQACIALERTQSDGEGHSGTTTYSDAYLETLAL